MATPDVSQQKLADLFSLRGRVAVVTGGAQGIGAAICHRLAEAGAAVVVADLNLAGAQQLAAAIEQGGGRAQAAAVDVSSASSQDELARQAQALFGGLDIWVNNAGIYPIKPTLAVTDDEWNRVLSINLTGTFYGARAAGRQMQAAGTPGVIVNMASSLGYHAVKQQAAYVATKFGVRGLTAALAVEWGEFNIRVLAVGPGLIDTEGIRHAASGLDALAHGDAKASYAQTSPAGRLGVADDIARAVLVAASDVATFMTGSTLLVDGGEVAAGGAA